jgi:hypothetical protein
MDSDSVFGIATCYDFFFLIYPIVVHHSKIDIHIAATNIISLPLSRHATCFGHTDCTQALDT